MFGVQQLIIKHVISSIIEFLEGSLPVIKDSVHAKLAEVDIAAIPNDIEDDIDSAVEKSALAIVGGIINFLKMVK